MRRLWLRPFVVLCAFAVSFLIGCESTTSFEPTTQPPTTHTPSTEVPTTQEPSTLGPTTMQPSTLGPTTAPITIEPTTEVTTLIPTKTHISTTPLTTSLIDQVVILNETIETGKLLEIAFYEPSGEEKIATLHNPYDYNEIILEVMFTSPTGTPLKQNGFWFRQYQELRVDAARYDEQGYITAGLEILQWLDGGISHYMVRIRPDEIGLWQFDYTLKIDGESVQTGTGEFTVTEGLIRPGVLMVDPVNNRTFVHEDGTSFFPNGANFAWYNSSLGTHDYYNWFKRLTDLGGNYVRIWLSQNTFALHRDSYTNFDSRQNMAIRLDYLFEFAEEYDIYIMLTLINHGQFSAVTNPNWSINPYNVANGGMLELPIQFFYNLEAKRAYKNELLYILARYGHSENVFAWELFNEVDWVDGYSSGVVTPWHREMSRFLKEHDPYNHMVTTSYKYTYGTDAYALDSIDFCAVHSYQYYDVNMIQKLLQETHTLYERYNKPVFFGEIGVDWRSGLETYKKDPFGITLHQGLWAGILGGGSGGAMHWWWDSWIDKYDLWYRFEGIGSYLKYMDLGHTAYSLIAADPHLVTSDNNIGVIGYVTDERVFGYMYHKQWTYYNRDADVIENASCTISVGNGDYQVMIFDTVTGLIQSSYRVHVDTEAVMLDFGDLATDVAFILIKD
ncbi:MAG: cellulase family glycosylhydrolase [Candidatus Izemoplasmatales bacterium]|nr:cellulase family glycosylhydrolase [Candidatus Izemoplasmatales bacterium]